jgi:hypothetical protein
MERRFRVKLHSTSTHISTEEGRGGYDLIFRRLCRSASVTLRILVHYDRMLSTVETWS